MFLRPPSRPTIYLLTLLVAGHTPTLTMRAEEPAATPPTLQSLPRTSGVWTVPPQNGALAPQSLLPLPELGKTPALSDDYRNDGGMALPVTRSPMRFAGRSGAGADSGAKHQRQREGTELVERRGRFEVNGDRVIFFAHDPEVHFVALENLALERVLRVIEESGSQLEWSISGRLTEFRSSNYLVVTRAIVKSLPGKDEPRPLAEPMTTGTPIAPEAGAGQVPATAARPGEMR